MNYGVSGAALTSWSEVRGQTLTTSWSAKTLDVKHLTATVHTSWRTPPDVPSLHRVHWNYTPPTEEGNPPLLFIEVPRRRPAEGPNHTWLRPWYSQGIGRVWHKSTDLHCHLSPPHRGHIDRLLMRSKGLGWNTLGFIRRPSGRTTKPGSNTDIASSYAVTSEGTKWTFH